MEAWNHDDFDAWIDQFDPEVEWFTLVEVYRGHAGARKAWESLKGTMQIRARFDDIRDLGESVLALGEMEGTGETTRLDVTGELAELVTYRGGKIVNTRISAAMPRPSKLPDCRSRRCRRRTLSGPVVSSSM